MGKAVNFSVFAIYAPNTFRKTPPIRVNLNCINPHFWSWDISYNFAGVFDSFWYSCIIHTKM